MQEIFPPSTDNEPDHPPEQAVLLTSDEFEKLLEKGKLHLTPPPENTSRPAPASEPTTPTPVIEDTPPTPIDTGKTPLQKERALLNKKLPTMVEISNMYLTLNVVDQILSSFQQADFDRGFDSVHDASVLTVCDSKLLEVLALEELEGHQLHSKDHEDVRALAKKGIRIISTFFLNKPDEYPFPLRNITRYFQSILDHTSTQG